MEKGKLKSSVVLFLIIALLCVICIGILLLFKYNPTKKPVNPGDVIYVGDVNTVSIKNIISVSSKFGKDIQEENGGAFGFVSFDVVNQSSEVRNYQIYITKNDSSTKEINNQYVTFYLTDGNNQPMSGYTREDLPKYSSLRYVEEKPSSKRLFTGSLSGNETAHFILRVWIAEPYIIQETAESFSFNIDACAV